MKVLTYGEIMDGGASVFHSVAKLDGRKLIVSFQGVIRIDNPYKFLAAYLEELPRHLTANPVESTTIDFVELKFCNSNGFYVIMDIVELIYNSVRGPVTVRRIGDDDWQQETLPILLNIDEQPIFTRTTFEEVRSL